MLLQDNPCCEEPDYRLLLIHALPWLEVLDLHAVTGAEHRKAAAAFGHYVGNSSTQTAESVKVIPDIAFGQRVPEIDPKVKETVPEISSLEQDLVKVSYLL